MPENYDVDGIAADLADCRQRGLDWLDQSTTNQTPIRALDLQQLADDYVTARQLVAAGRIDQIKLLLRHGIDQFARQGHSSEADIIRDLFFGESTGGAIRSPGELLKRARDRIGDSETRFLQRRRTVIRSFARFLTEFVASAAAGNDHQDPIVAETYTQLVTTGYVSDSEHFIQLLADATKVTIVGITNEHLKPMLEEAVRRKRAIGRPDAFWESLRIVFLESSLLAVVNDEREQLNDKREALRQRREESFYADKSVQTFLRKTYASHWEVFKNPYIPALTGSLLEFANHRKIAHLLIRRSRSSDTENIYLDLEDHQEQLSAVFEDIVRHSKSNYNVPVGVPVIPPGDTAYKAFRWDRPRLASKVLKRGSGASGWLPMVLIITYRNRNGHLEPVLQLRTEENSGRELDRLSHLSSHISEEDCETSGGDYSIIEKYFDLDSAVSERAARRQIQDVIGLEKVSLRPQTTGRYLYGDIEHLFFFIFSLELSDDIHLPRRAEMYDVPVRELLAIRAKQVLRSAAELCEMPIADEGRWRAAVEVLVPNLVLHGQDDLADRLRTIASRSVDQRADAADLIRAHVNGTEFPRWTSAHRAEEPEGLAGWQFREFFSVLLPRYVEIGIHQAAEVLDEMANDSRKLAAQENLRQLYQDEELVALLPLQL